MIMLCGLWHAFRNDCNFSTFSKCFRAFLMFTRVDAEAVTQRNNKYLMYVFHLRIDESVIITITYVFGVNVSMKAANV